MVNATIEDRGRVLIPKKIRDKMNLRGGEVVNIETKDDQIIITKQKTAEDLKALKGCVEDSEIDPIDVKNIWSTS